MNKLKWYWIIPLNFIVSSILPTIVNYLAIVDIHKLPPELPFWKLCLIEGVFFGVILNLMYFAHKWFNKNE